MTTTGSSANRRFARVAERVAVRFRTLDPAAAERVAREIALGAQAIAPPDAPADAARTWERSVLAQILARLDRLEDTVARLSGTGGAPSAWIAGETTCLSGGGLALEAPVAPPEGASIELEIDLPGTTNGTIRALGRVVGSPAGGATGVAFSSIAEDDRERIVRFSFRSQRAHLRERRR